MHGTENPSAWVQRWTHLIAPQSRVLDVACGAGRHMRWLAAQGHHPQGVDRNSDAVALAQAFGPVTCADIENGPWPFAGQTFAAVVVTHYLWRPLLPAIVQCVAPGGVLIYETFAAGNESVGKPSRPDFLLQAGELLRAYGFSQGVDSATGDALARGAGAPFGATEAGARMEDTTRRRGQDVAAGSARYSADSSAAAARYGVDQREAGADRRTAIEVNPGNVAVVGPNHPLAGRADPNGRIQGNPSLTTAQGDAAGQIVANPNMAPADRERLRSVLPGVAATEVRGQQAADLQTLRGQQRIEQITLQGQQATDLQVLRGEQAAGRLDTQGQQRLQQLEVQNSAAMERVQAQQDGANARAAGRPAAAVPVGVSKRIEEVIAAGTDVEGDTFQFDPEAQRWLRARTEALYQGGEEGVRGSIENAYLAARQEFLDAKPGRADSSMNPFSSRTYTLPQALRQPAAPARGMNGMQVAPTDTPAASGATNLAPRNLGLPAPAGRQDPRAVLAPQPGDTVRQNGLFYIIQPDGSARPLS